MHTNMPRLKSQEENECAGNNLRVFCAGAWLSFGWIAGGGRGRMCGRENLELCQ